MFGLSKKEQFVPAPLINPEELDHDLMQESGFRGNIESPRDCEESMQELLETVPIADEKGLTKQVTTLKRRAIASFLQERGMMLLKTDGYYSEKDYHVYRYGTDGVLHPLNKQDRSYRTTALKNFEWSVPAKIIREMPEHMIDGARVLWQENDPIIYLKITNERDGKWWGIALYKW